MKLYDVCLRLQTVEVYRLRAQDEDAAIAQATAMAESRDGVDEVLGGSAEHLRMPSDAPS